MRKLGCIRLIQLGNFRTFFGHAGTIGRYKFLEHFCIALSDVAAAFLGVQIASKSTCDLYLAASDFSGPLFLSDCS
jgi:hypothetical protein